MVKLLKRLGFYTIHSHKPHIDELGRYVMTEHKLLVMHRKLDYTVFWSKNLPDKINDGPVL